MLLGEKPLGNFSHPLSYVVNNAKRNTKIKGMFEHEIAGEEISLAYWFSRLCG